MFAETLAGIALEQVDDRRVQKAISTAKDISEIADDIDKLFTGEQQIQKKKQKRSPTHSALGSSVKTIDAKSSR